MYMKFYKERNGLLQNLTHISGNDLKRYWLGIYKYFQQKGYFQLAETGIKHGNNFVELRFAPDPEQYFLLHLGKDQMWPVEDHISRYSEEDIFTAIEIYYANIAKCEWVENDEGDCGWSIDNEKPKQEFAIYVNNILKLYKEGYYLEPAHGFVMPLPNEALRHQLIENYPDIPSDIYDQMRSATKDFYHFDATLERKRKAIASMADILELLRNELKEILNEEFQVNKNNHDKLIFEIVNNYHIRHDNDKQFKEYSKEIWYDWMMQYYTSTIIAYYRLKAEREKEEWENLF